MHGMNKLLVGHLLMNEETTQESRVICGPSDSKSGFAIGVLGLLVGSAPSLYILYLLGAGWLSLAAMPEPPASIRPMGFAAAAFLATGVGVFICSPVCFICSWVARSIGSEDGAAIARLGVGMFTGPLAIAILGIPLMCFFTGVQLGDHLRDSRRRSQNCCIVV